MPRWEPNARLRLVESALELFERQGYDETGVAQIAEAAGLTKTTFFRHFPDKREVLFAGQESHRELLAQGVAAAPPDATPLDAVGAALDALAASFPEDRQTFAARLQAVIDGHGELQERAAMKRAGYVDALAAALHARSVPDPTAAVAAELGVLAFYSAFHRWAQEPAPSPLEVLVHDALREHRAVAAALR